MITASRRLLGIRARAIFILLVLATIPAILIGLGSDRILNDGLVETVEANIEESVRLHARETEQLLERTAHDLTLWAKLQVMQDVLIDDELGEIGDEISDLADSIEILEQIVVTNGEGQVVASNVPGLLGLRLHLPGLMDGQVSLYFDADGLSHQAAGFAAAPTLVAPIHADYDPLRVIGMLMGVIDLQQLLGHLDDASIGGFHTGDALQLAVVRKADGALLHVTGRDYLEPAQLAALANGKERQVRGRSGRSLVVGRAEARRGALGLDLDSVLVAAVASDIAFADLTRLRRLSLGIVLGSLLLSLAVGWIAGGKLIAPLAGLAVELRRIAEGRTASAVPHIDRQDEIGDMARALERFRLIAIEQTSQTSELRRAKELAEATEMHAQHLAHHDTLTGLGNRAAFNKDLAAAINDGQPFALVCIDLDDFKEVNDTLGHGAGDQLLQHVGRRLRHELRQKDHVYRLGGDEFAVLVQCAGAQLTDGKEPIDATVSRCVAVIGRAFDLDGHSVTIGASAGLALCPADGSEASQLLARADMALYEAKRAGRNLWRRFVAPMEAQLLRRLADEQGLREALAEDQLLLVYQPQVALDDCSIVGAEALLRWQQPQRGQVLAASFIKTAEQSGLIVDIDRALRARSAGFLRRLGAQLSGAQLSVAFNLSPIELKAGSAVASFEALLEASGWPAQKIKIELTEQAIMMQSEECHRQLIQLKALGFRLALDDFGTGFSSLSHLRDFPFDEIKIDRSFTARIASEPQALAVVRGLLGIGRALGIEVVAEGIDSDIQLATLRNEGCRLGQGHLFSRPLSEADLLSTIERGRCVGPERQGQGEAFPLDPAVTRA